MKKIIITLVVILTSLGGHAQTNPRIDSLIINCLRRGRENVQFDKKGIYIDMLGITYHMAQFKDTTNYIYVSESNQELKAIIDVCRQLSKEAKESYLWESHEEGKDTLMYLLTLNNPICRETLKLIYTDKNVSFETLDGDETNELEPKGWYEFEYHLENGDNSRNHFIDVAEMNRRIAPILQNDSIERHEIYIRHDRSYTAQTEELEYRQGAANLPLWFDTESRGTLYTIPSKEMADKVFLQLGKVITQYFKENPWVIHIGRNPFPRTYEHEKWSMTLVYSDVYDYTLENDTPHEYNILFYPPGNNYDGVCRLLVVESNGHLWLPKGWRTMKSWVNGKAVYYKK